MKLTKETLKRIIKEELEESYKEYPSTFDGPVGTDRFLTTPNPPHFDKIKKLLNDGPSGVNQAISLMEMIPEYGIKSVSTHINDWNQKIVTIRFEAPEGTSYDHSMGAVESEFIYRHLKHAGVPVGEFYSDDTKAIITIRNQDI